MKRAKDIQYHDENDINQIQMISQLKLVPTKSRKRNCKKTTIISRLEVEKKQINMLVFKTKSESLREQNELLKSQMVDAQNETYHALSLLNASKKKCTDLSQQVMRLSYSQNLIHLRDYYHESQQEINKIKQDSKEKTQEIEQKINHLQNKLKKLQGITDEAQNKNDLLHQNSSKLDQKLQKLRAENIQLSLQVSQNNKLTTDELNAAYKMMESQKLSFINDKYQKEIKQLEEEKQWTKQEYSDLVDNLQALRLKVQSAEHEIQQTKLRMKSHQ